MLFYFPQWQGSGTGETIRTGASQVIEYLNQSHVEIPLSNRALSQKQDINGYDALFEQLSSFKQVLSEINPETLKIVGGDCGLEIIPVSYLASKYENIGVIWFDAHADFNIPEESPSKNFHGMPLRTLIGEGDRQFSSLLFETITPDQIHYLGLRSVDKIEQIKLNEYGVFAEYKTSIDALVETLKSKHINNIYIHFDVDCLDPNDFEYSYYKVHNGLSVNESISYLKALNDNFKVIGTSLLETVVTNKKDLNPLNGILEQLFN